MELHLLPRLLGKGNSQLAFRAARLEQAESIGVSRTPWSGHRSPLHSINYAKVVNLPVNAAVLEDVRRPGSIFNFALLDWLHDDGQTLLETIFFQDKTTSSRQQKMTRRELEYLVVEFSWKSSAFEGNTYSLLDTELLLTQGVPAKNKTTFETQMIFNHQSAMNFIIEHPELFQRDITFSSVEEIHKCTSYSLGIQTGIRRRPVRISASNYEPLTTPTRLREVADLALRAINGQSNPFIKALLAFSLLPYIQAFEDGNKRVGRMLANAILIHVAGCGISLRKIEAKQLALAYLAFYEFGSLSGLHKILSSELKK